MPHSDTGTRVQEDGVPWRLGTLAPFCFLALSDSMSRMPEPLGVSQEVTETGSQLFYQCYPYTGRGVVGYG